MTVSAIKTSFVTICLGFGVALPNTLLAEDLRALRMHQHVEVTKKITEAYTAGHMEKIRKTKIKKGLVVTIDVIHRINQEVGPNQQKVGYAIFVNSRKGRFKIEHSVEISLVSLDRLTQLQQIDSAYQQLAVFDGFQALKDY